MKDMKQKQKRRLKLLVTVLLLTVSSSLMAQQSTDSTACGSAIQGYATALFGNACWMVDNARFPECASTGYQGQKEGSRGYYYSWTQAAPHGAGADSDICSANMGSDWHLPSSSDWIALRYALELSKELRNSWNSESALAGKFSNSLWTGWDTWGYWWGGSEDGYRAVIARKADSIGGPSKAGADELLPVRCVLN
ncbi:MAG: hypothetical protein LBN93_05805 [Candidatus Symbiothrix sp.]|nr:hypothetical protein [Candidatus Symbiothrix sp.]